MRLVSCFSQGLDFSYDDLAADLLRLHQRQLAEDNIEVDDLRTYSSQCKEAFARDVMDKVEEHKLLTFLPDIKKHAISTAAPVQGTSSIGRLNILHPGRSSLFCVILGLIRCCCTSVAWHHCKGGA